MKKITSQKQNLNFWESRAEENTGHTVSWWDINMKYIEIQNICSCLSKNDLILDVGCSNGASTREIAKLTGCRIHGIDYSKKAILQTQELQSKQLSFEKANILNYKSKIKYDKIYSIRCLINLISFEYQKKALINIYNLLNDDGVYIMAEAFLGGLSNLNHLRKEFGLKPLVEPRNNLYFREGKFEKFISRYFHIIEIKKYASLYYLGTRFFQYLTMNSNPSGHDTELHRFFAHYGYETEYSGDYSPQKMYIMRKK